MEQHPPTIFTSPDPPPFPAPSRSIDLSPLEFVLALIAIIIIPALIYTFFYSIKCPPSPFFWRQRDDDGHYYSDGFPEIAPNPIGNKEMVSDLKYRKEAHVKDLGSECPVCLSLFADGEEVKQLSMCRHSFHSSCIDKWLSSHSNCPVCRATVPSKKTTVPVSSSSSSSRDNDLHQGLPDAANLV